MNELQQKVVETTEGPVIINAGPGTGKTKTLTARIAYLINEKNIDPSCILAVTFTKKASSEMKERLALLLKNRPLPMIITFHAFGYDLLKEKSESLKIINDQRRQEIVEELIATHKSFQHISLKEILLTISRIKNSDSNAEDPESVEFVKLYSAQLENEQLIDFDDMLLKAYHLLKNDESHLEAIRDRYHYILVDEFQDTNDIQYQLIKLIAGRHKNIFIIGDPYQSIYSFRGASAEIFNTFKKDFPQYLEITLSQNYRSSSQIIAVSSHLFPGEISLEAMSQQRGKVCLIETLNEYTEADYIVRDIGKKVGGTDLLQSGDLKVGEDQGAHFCDFAVIYRTHRLSRVLQQKFDESGIPFQIVGEGSPYKQKEIQLINAALTYIHEPTSELLQRVIELRKNHNKNTLSLLQQIPAHEKVSRLIELIIEVFKIEEQLENKPDKKINLKQFLSAMLQFDRYEDGLARCTSYISHLQDHEFYDENADKVTLLTMHAAKGLEFPYVYICGFEERLIPFIRQNGRDAINRVSTDLEEEKRLLYVAMTRAKKELYLLCAKMRNREKTDISRFQQLISCEDLKFIEDEATGKILKKREKEKIKKSQMKLF